VSTRARCHASGRAQREGNSGREREGTGGARERMSRQERRDGLNPLADWNADHGDRPHRDRLRRRHDEAAA
jgi:hypothetical protein